MTQLTCRRSLSSNARVSVVCAAMLVAAAGSIASAQQTFNFTNDCATGLWNTACNPSAGVWRNNWGRTAASSGALAFPGSVDTANILAGGSATLSSSVGVATLNIAPGAIWNWTAGNLTVGTGTATIGLQNAGQLEHSAAGTLLTGQFSNAAGAVWTSTGPTANLRLEGLVTGLNDGTMVMVNGADISYGFNGPVSQKQITNNGLIRVTNPAANGDGSNFSSVALVGTSTGRWRVESNAIMNLPGAQLSGFFVGDHAAGGIANFGGMSTLGPTTLSLLPSSATPWRWTGGDVIASAAVLTNTGQVEHTASGNLLIGQLTNASGATWTSTGPLANLRLEGLVSFLNEGTIVLSNGADITYGFNGPVAQKRITNSGLIRVINPLANGESSNLSSVSLIGTPNGRWRVESGAVMNFIGALTSGDFVGDHAAGGTANFGGMTLADDATLSLLPNSVAAWRWTTGDVNASAALLTNAGAVEHTAAGSLLVGQLTNAAGATWTSTGASANLRLEGLVTLVNDGTMILANGADVSYGFNGPVADKQVFNNRLIRVINPAVNGDASVLSGFVLQNATPQSVLRVESNAALTVNAVASGVWTHAAGRIEGLGRLLQSGTFTVTGTPGANPPATLVRGVIAPGIGDGAAAAEVGTLRIGAGQLVMTPNSELEITLRNSGGAMPVQTADQLRIDDTGAPNAASTLGGVLRIRRAPGTTGVLGGQEYVIVNVVGNGGTLAGTFSQVIDATPLTDVRYAIRYTPTQVIMRVIRKCGVSDVAGGNQEPLYDGAATADDVIVFLNWYFGGDLRADYAGANQALGSDGNLTADDIIVFLGFFFQGCGF